MWNFNVSIQKIRNLNVNAHLSQNFCLRFHSTMMNLMDLAICNVYPQIKILCHSTKKWNKNHIILKIGVVHIEGDMWCETWAKLVKWNPTGWIRWLGVISRSSLQHEINSPSNLGCAPKWRNKWGGPPHQWLDQPNHWITEIFWDP